MNIKALPFILSAFTFVDGSLLLRTQVATGSEFGRIVGRVLASKEESKLILSEQAKFRMLTMSLNHAMSLDFGEAMSMSMSMPFDDGMSMPFDDGMSMPHDETMSLDLTMSMPDSTNAEPADTMPACDHNHPCVTAHITFEEEASNLAMGPSNPASDAYTLTSESNASASEGLPTGQIAMIVVVALAAASIALVVVQRKFAKNKNDDDKSVVTVEPMLYTIYDTVSMTGHHV